jgi:hypothetical protein
LGEFQIFSEATLHSTKLWFRLRNRLIVGKLTDLWKLNNLWASSQHFSPKMILSRKIKFLKIVPKTKSHSETQISHQTQCPFKNVTHLTHSNREWMDFLLRLWQARFAYFFPNWKVNRKVRQIKIFSWTSLILPEQTLINYFDLFQLLLYKYTKNFRGSTLSLHSEYAWGRVSVFAWGWEIWKNLFFCF